MAPPAAASLPGLSTGTLPVASRPVPIAPRAAPLAGPPPSGPFSLPCGRRQLVVCARDYIDTDLLARFEEEAADRCGAPVPGLVHTLIEKKVLKTSTW